MMCLFFGSNALLFFVFQYIKRQSIPHTISEEIIDEKKKVVTKQLSKPFTGTIDCFTNLTAELFRVGCIMAFTYVCEKHPFYPHSSKHYSRDLFVFVCIIFFAYAFITIKPVTDLSLLGREQTEEWKGWMQFIFLLYHYFHAEETYNAVRCMITCYVWMTGFGNFSFFYMKQDFGWLRVVQMLWRLNFAVLLLMWTHGNTYILYYICPLHTFYFLMVYACMYVMQDQNHTKWGVRIKLMVLALLIFIIWDINGGIFDILFGFLGTSRTIGANSGSVYEWYFRTSLDHWSTFLGMIFALNYPMAEQYFAKAGAGSLAFASSILGTATLLWFYFLYTLPKLEYNMSHAYFSIIPLLSYIFFRNITPYVRSGVSRSLHEIGKTTLETYLLQHHIWLTSNAKTLLTIVPDYPWINFAVVSVIFFILARELYRLTMSLRGMMLPDDRTLALRNILGLGGVFAALGGIAFLLHMIHPELGAIMMACGLVFVVTMFLIQRFFKSTAENATFASVFNKCVIGGGILIVVGLIIQLVIPGVPPPVENHRRLAVAKWPDAKPVVSSSKYVGGVPPVEVCLQQLVRGSWETQPCPSDMAGANAMCHVDLWKWSASTCQIKIKTSKELQGIIRNKKVAFIGDSMVRNVYHSMNAIVDDTYIEDTSTEHKHANQNFPIVSSNSTIDYFWAPYVKDVKTTLQKFSPGEYKIIIMGVAAFDALNKKDVNAYLSGLDKIAEEDIVTNLGAFTIWLQPTTIQDSRLPPFKLEYMNETSMELYRNTFLSSKLKDQISFTLNPKAVTVGQETSSSDGIHYSHRVSQVLAQMVVNAFTLKNPKDGSAKGGVAIRTGAMGHPLYGFIVIVFSAIMVIFFDSFFGVGVLSLYIFGVTLDWESSYRPLLNKIFHKLPTAVEISQKEDERPLLEKPAPPPPSPSPPKKRGFLW